MLYFYKHDMTVNMALSALNYRYGWFSLAVGVLCAVLAYGLTRYIHTKTPVRPPSSHRRFLPHVLSRMIFPAINLGLIILAQIGWVAWQQRPSEILSMLAAMLVWLVIIRVLTAVVRQALPNNKLEWLSEQFLATALWLGFVCWAVEIDGMVIDWMRSMSFTIGKNHLSLYTVVTALIWVTIIIVISLWVSRVLDTRIMRLRHIDLNLRIVFSKLAQSLLVVLAVLIALPIVGINLTVLSVFGGALGVGLGLGLQRIASNYVSGFIILLDRSIRVGDRLMIDNRVGYVTKITSRYVVLKGLDGSEALVPNEVLMSNTVINQSYSDKAIWISLKVQVAYGTDLDLALELARKAADHPRVLQSSPPGAFITNFGGSGIDMEVGFWVADPENGFMGLKSDILLAIWRSFTEYGIEIPFPQQEVRILNQDSSAAAPADQKPSAIQMYQGEQANNTSGKASEQQRSESTTVKRSEPPPSSDPEPK